jgi:type I restriction enzyme S subunit
MARGYDDYEDSGVRGLDQIPAHWEENRAKRYFEPVDVRSETGAEQLLSVSHHRGVEPRDDEKVHMIKAESYEGYKLCEPGDLVINSMWAWKGGLGISEHAGIISTAYSVFRLRDASAFDLRFLNWLLRTNLYIGEYLCRSKGIWQSRLTLSDREFLNIPIFRPPLDEQRAIVEHANEKLGQIQRFTEAKQQLIERREEQRAAVVNRAVTKGLDAGAKTKPSGVEWLGEIPAHWEMPKVRYSLDEIVGGGTPPKAREEFWNGSVPWVSPKDMKRDRIRETEDYISEEAVSQSSTKFVAPGSVLVVVRSGILERTFPVALNEVRVTMNQDMKALTPRDTLAPEYLAYLLKGTETFILAQCTKIAATVGSIETNDFLNMRIPVPPLDEQRRIIAHVRQANQQIDAAIERAEREIALIEEYRRALIVETVTGQIDVRDRAPGAA